MGSPETATYRPLSRAWEAAHAEKPFRDMAINAQDAATRVPSDDASRLDAVGDALKTIAYFEGVKAEIRFDLPHVKPDTLNAVIDYSDLLPYHRHVSNAAGNVSNVLAGKKHFQAHVEPESQEGEIVSINNAHGEIAPYINDIRSMLGATNKRTVPTPDIHSDPSLPYYLRNEKSERFTNQLRQEQVTRREYDTQFGFTLVEEQTDINNYQVVTVYLQHLVL